MTRGVVRPFTLRLSNRPQPRGCAIGVTTAITGALRTLCCPSRGVAPRRRADALKRMTEDEGPYDRIERSGDRRSRKQTGRFVVTQHQIEILNRLAGSAFTEIVDRGEDAQGLRPTVERERQFAEISRAHIA